MVIRQNGVFTYEYIEYGNGKNKNDIITPAKIITLCDRHDDIYDVLMKL